MLGNFMNIDCDYQQEKLCSKWMWRFNDNVWDLFKVRY